MVDTKKPPNDAPSTDPEVTRPSLRERIRNELKLRGITQASLAEITGYTKPYLSRLLSGKRNIGLIHVQVIAKAFDMDPATLVAGTDGQELVQAMASYVERAEFETVEKRLAEASTELAAARAEAQAARAANAVLEDRLRTLMTDQEQIVRERDELVATTVPQHDFDAARADIARLSRELAVAKVLLHFAQKQRAELEASHAELDARLQQHLLDMGALSRERDDALAAASSANERAATLQNKVFALRVGGVFAEARTAELSKQNEALRRELAASNEQTQINYDAWRQTSQQLAGVTAQIKVAYAQIANLQAQVAQARQETQARANGTLATALLTGLVGFGLGASEQR